MIRPRFAALSNTIALTGLTFLGQSAARAQTSAYFYTNAAQTYTVPSNVNAISISLWGAGGALNGGAGAFVSGTLAVTPNQVLTLIVGGNGQGGAYVPLPGSYGGGGNSASISDVLAGTGGGYTGIFVGSTPLAIAGGGGGGSQVTIGVYASHLAGGGGILVGGTSGDGIAGGTQTAGGPLGGYLQGGNGQSQSDGHGTGGGGGYYGGGSGYTTVADYYVRAAGGGSSYLGTLTNLTVAAGGQGSPSGVQAPGSNVPGYAAGVGNGGIGGRNAIGPAGNGGAGEALITVAGFTPEPSTIALLALTGLPAIGMMTRRRR